MIRILIALLLGCVAYFIAQLFLPHPIPVIIGVLVALLYYFSVPDRTQLLP